MNDIISVFKTWLDGLQVWKKKNLDDIHEMIQHSVNKISFLIGYYYILFSYLVIHLHWIPLFSLPYKVYKCDISTIVDEI